MYTYQDIAFRPIEIGDLEELRKLHNDASTLLQLGHVELVSAEQQLEWWKSLSHNKSVQRHSIVEVSSGRVIGMVRIQNIDGANRNCEIGLDIVAELRGRGYGRKSYEMLLEYLFKQFNMHMVYLRVGAFNDRALQLYKRLGFKPGGAYPEFLYRHGKYWDYLLFAMTRLDYDERQHHRAEA